MFGAAVVTAIAPKKGADWFIEDLIEDAIYNVIFAAALEHHGKLYGEIRSPRNLETGDVKIHRPKQYRIILLGAWVCGAYKDDPQLMADRFRAVVKRHREEIALFWDEINFPPQTPRARRILTVSISRTPLVSSAAARTLATSHYSC